MTNKASTVSLDEEAEAIVSDLVNRARNAQLQFEAYTQEQVDEVVIATAWALLEPQRNQELSELAVSTTGLGNVKDKITKNHRKTMGLLRDLKGARTVGVVRELPELGLVEIARPVGVVGAVVPSTNPAATPMNKTLNALKGRNAIILAPSPKGQEVCTRLINYIHAELDRIGAPRDLVQQLPAPVNKATTHQLMHQADLVVVTGSQNNVRSAYSSGGPAIGVGAGNVPVIIDSTADLAAAAAKIRLSKTFDNATSCSSENNLVIVDDIYEEAIKALAVEGGIVLTPEEKAQLQRTLWVDGNLNRDVIAKSAPEIAEACGFTRPELRSATMLLVEETGVGKDYPFSGEKLSPVLTVYRAPDFDGAYARTREILEHQGKGHSCGIHTQDEAHINRLGLHMPVCRVIVNQAHAVATGGSFDNGLPFSLSMGCGTWGQNSISENLNYRHYLNTTRVVKTITPNEPTLDEIFGDYWQKFGLPGA